MRRLGPVQQKIVLALLGGVVLGLSPSPRQYFRTLRAIRNEWRDIDQRNFNRSIKSLSKEKLLTEKVMPDGSFRIELTKHGQQKAKELHLRDISLNIEKPKRWNGMWLIVLFDIPEKDRMFRDILREHLQALKFLKLQHSVFISPHPLEKPILELITLYSAEQYVRVVTAVKIDNEAKIKKMFKLP
jgi:phenylacetic acid degradation operon negative regulatory protein